MLAHTAQYGRNRAVPAPLTFYAPPSFQIAGTIGVAIRNDQSFAFPVWAYSEYYKNPIPQIERAHLLNLDLKLYDATTPFHYRPVSLEGRYDWDIIGYLQSEKYFKHCENTIREYFTLKDHHVAYLKSKYGHLLEANCCSISVRRGDYLLAQHKYPVLSMDYFNRAVAQFPSDTIYLELVAKLKVANAENE